MILRLKTLFLTLIIFPPFQYDGKLAEKNQVTNLFSCYVQKVLKYGIFLKTMYHCDLILPYHSFHIGILVFVLFYA